MASAMLLFWPLGLGCVAVGQANDFVLSTAETLAASVAGRNPSWVWSLLVQGIGEPFGLSTSLEEI